MKKLVSIILSLIIMLSCVAMPLNAFSATTITTPVTTLNFAKGCSNTLVIYASGKRAGSGTVSFSSSNKNVATVDKAGKVSAKKKGTAYITVKLKRNKNIYKKIKINVLDTKSFKITPSSTPLNASFLNFGTYNAKTKQYYTIRSYLEYFEKKAGCTLTFADGTYNVCNVLCIPSNTTIKLSSKTILKKTSKTDTSALSPSSTLFAMCPQSMATKSKVYSKYNGVHDVKIIGSGNATIDMKNTIQSKISCAMVMCHNQNISVSGINFTNLKLGHFMEIDASKNVSVTNCTFKNQVHSSESSASECINLDTPDSKTNGFHQVWAVNDSYPNVGVKISNCSFYNVQRAVGTHQYTQDKYHKNITIANCLFKKCVYGAVCAMNWKNLVIKDNTFNGVGKDTDGKAIVSNSLLQKDRTLFFAGCYDGFSVTGNSFKNCYQIGIISTHNANGYNTIYNSITDEEFSTLELTNYYTTGVDCPYVKTLNNWDNNGASWHEYYMVKK